MYTQITHPVKTPFYIVSKLLCVKTQSMCMCTACSIKFIVLPSKNLQWTPIFCCVHLFPTHFACKGIEIMTFNLVCCCYVYKRHDTKLSLPKFLQFFSLQSLHCEQNEWTTKEIKKEGDSRLAKQQRNKGLRSRWLHSFPFLSIFLSI